MNNNTIIIKYLSNVQNGWMNKQTSKYLRWMNVWMDGQSNICALNVL